MKYGLILLVFLSLASSLVLLFGSDVLTLPWSGSREQHVYSRLMDTSEASLLETAELYLNILCPYDFVGEEDEADWSFLKRQYDRDPSYFAVRASEEFYPDGKLPGEWRYASLYALCRDSGFDPAGDDGFIVISTICRAGLSFDDGALNLEDLEDSGKISLPSARITDILIKDRSSGRERYPDVRLEPEQWSRLIRNFRPEIEALAMEEGLLSAAEETAASLVTDLFEGAGYDVQEVLFIP